MLAKFIHIVKVYRKDILLTILIILISLFSFACGFITATYLQKEPIRIEEKA